MGKRYQESPSAAWHCLGQQCSPSHAHYIAALPNLKEDGALDAMTHACHIHCPFGNIQDA